MTEAFTQLVSDPSVVYLMLLAGLWMAVTVVYTPGTVIAEVVSGALLLVALLALTSMPTNWWALIVLVLGVSGFLALPFVSAKWANVADIGLVFQGIGGYFLFSTLSVSPLVILFTLLIGWGYHRLVLLPVLRHHRDLAQVNDKNALIGARGRVVKTLNPVGTVYVEGELWTARANETLETDYEIVVLSKQGLELRVEKAKHTEESAL